jgi:hypothetical protein
MILLDDPRRSGTKKPIRLSLKGKASVYPLYAYGGFGASEHRSIDLGPHPADMESWYRDFIDYCPDFYQLLRLEAGLPNIA